MKDWRHRDNMNLAARKFGTHLKLAARKPTFCGTRSVNMFTAWGSELVWLLI